jgi:hypothetical protein
MPRRLLCATLVALLAPPAAFAAEHVDLTIYHANGDALFSGSSQGTLNDGHALVHEQRKLDVRTGSQELRIGGLPATLDPEAIAVTFGSGPVVSVLGQRVMLANASASGALDGAIGSHVYVSSGISTDAGGGGFNGILLGASVNGVLIRTPDGKVHLVHQYASVTLPADAVSGGSSLLLDVEAKAAGNRDTRLTYTTSGLGWRAAYTADLSSGDACRMRFKPEASIANRSSRDYDRATIKLIAGQPNLGNRSMTLQSIVMKGPAPMAAAAAMPRQAGLGDYRSFTLPGVVNLPNGTVTLTPLYPAHDIVCQREYVIEDGRPGYPPKPNTNDYGAQNYRDRPIASTLAFAAPKALPAGTLRAWMTDHDGTPALLGEGAVVDTPKGQHVSVQLGQSFDLRASRERTAFHVAIKAHMMSESYKLLLINGGDAARTVTVREHPDRWREWHVTSSSIKPSKQTPQLLEFKVPVPADGRTTLEYTVQYHWTARDR